MRELNHPFMVSIKAIEKRLDELTTELKTKQIQDPQYIFFDNADFIQLLKISPETATNWRKKGLIAFSQPSNGKIYYKLSDIQIFLDNHYRPFKKK